VIERQDALGIVCRDRTSDCGSRDTRDGTQDGQGDADCSVCGGHGGANGTPEAGAGIAAPCPLFIDDWSQKSICALIFT
jgi:hypothetical protein